MRKKTTIISALMLLLMLGTALEAEGFVVDGIAYGYTRFEDMTTLRVVKISGGYSGDIEIPHVAHYDGTDYLVTEVGAEAFRNCTGLNSVTLSINVKYIGDYAFAGCTNLTSVTISGLTTISTLGTGVFENCHSLSSFNVPGAKSIGERCFYGAGLKSIDLPWTVNSIGNEAFSECDSLVEITIGDNITHLSQAAFKGCDRLEKVSFSNKNNITSIEPNTFESCTQLSQIVFPTNLQTIGDNAFKGCTAIERVVLPDSVIAIGKYVLNGCSNLESVTLGCKVTSIGNQMTFGGCDKLTSLTCLALEPPTIGDEGGALGSDFFSRVTLNVLPDAIEAYQSATFWNHFSSIEGNGPGDGYNFAVDGIYYTIENGKATVINNGSTGCYSGNIVIPDEVTYQGVTFPVTAIGKSAFWKCHGLTRVTLPNTIRSIGDYAFVECYGLHEIDLPSSLTEIGAYAFYLCFNISSVTIPDSVTVINQNAFDACGAVKTLTIGKSVTTIDNSALNFVQPNTLIWNAKQCYTGSLYTLNITNVQIGDEVEVIPDYLVYSSKITHVTVPNSVTTIGTSVFKGCSNLTSATLGRGVTSIDKSIFYDCDQMTELTCLAHTPPGFNDTDFGLFKELDDYARVTLHVPASSVNAYQTAVIWSNFSQIVGDAPGISEDDQDFMVDGIYYHVEEGQATVTNNGQTGCYSGDVVIPDVVTYQGISYPVVAVGDSAFKDCAALTNITLGDSITIIGTSAFQGCTGLTSITIPKAATSIESYAFHFCTGLTYVALPNSLTTIDEFAFSNCVNLTSITIPESVTLIKGYSFYGCRGIKSVVFNATNCEYLGVYSLFNDCPLESIVFGESVHQIPSLIVKGKTQLTSVTIPNSVTSIGREAFAGCEGITSLLIGNSVNYIGIEAFSRCMGLTELVLPNSLTDIDLGAFSACKGLTVITLPNSVITIGASAFSSCSALRNITLSNSLTSIGNYSFGYCTELTEVSLPNAVTTIGDGAFKGCSKLAYVLLGSGVNNIGNTIFGGCSQMRDLICLATTPPVCSDALFYDMDYYTLATLHVLPSCVEVYQSTMYWQDFSQILGDVPGDIPGDVNGDGEVNVADVNKVIDVIINGGSHGHGHAPSSEGETDSEDWSDINDVNGDGEINIADVNIIISIILGS